MRKRKKRSKKKYNFPFSKNLALLTVMSLGLLNFLSPLNATSSYFNDAKPVKVEVTTRFWNPPVVLNEFLPNAGDYPEFVEIYNKTGSDIDLDGFYIKANDNNIPINTTTTNDYSGDSTIIPANGWLVVTADGNLINDSFGTIALYNSNNVVVDSYGYGTPDHNVNNTPGWTNNLVGYWPFDGDTQDLSGNGNNGTNYGAAPVSGKINQALSFDGTNDYMEAADSVTLKPTSVTLEAWVKASSPGSYKYITSKSYNSDHASYAFYTASSGGLRFYIGHAGGYILSPDAGTGIWDNNWHHVVGTYDGSNVRLYVDGAEKGAGTPTTMSIAYNTNKFYVGSYGNGFYFNGIVDEVKIYNRALDAAEISKHYNDIGSLGTVPVDKSYARIPDGVGAWVDPMPTPGGPNKLVKTDENIPDEIVVENVAENTASLSFSETLGAVAGAITEFVLGEEETSASPSAETVVDVPDLTPVASVSVEPPLDSPAGDLTGQALPEASPEVTPSPELSPEPLVIPEPTVTPEPIDSPQPQTGDESLIQTVAEPAIPVEPVTVEPPAEPAPPPTDPPAPAPEQAPAPVDSAPAPAE